MYFTLEAANPRLKKGCSNKGDKVFVNTYFYRGTRYPGNAGLLYPLGYMGSSMFHVTVGKPDMVLNAGTYTLMVANWAGTPRLDYSLIVYQEGSGRVSGR